MFSRRGIGLSRAKVIFWLMATAAVSWIIQFPMNDDPKDQRWIKEGMDDYGSGYYNKEQSQCK